jgi:hypothetical protein
MPSSASYPTQRHSGTLPLHLTWLPALLIGLLAMWSVPDLHSQATSDCARDSPKTIFIAFRTDGAKGSGLRADPFNGSTRQGFDKILRDRSEGGVTDLIVCIGPGTYDTEGSYDYIIGIGHQGVLDYKYPLQGFTVGKNWKIHGAGSSGPGRTTLRLADIYPHPRVGFPLGATVFGTISDSASGVEISDLEIDDNYRGITGNANLAAIDLRSDEGGHWIHRIHVINSEGKFSEAFPVSIMSVNFRKPPSQNNIIEHVTMDNWGGGLCTAISIANAVGEVRYNTVTGYQIAFGGWAVGPASFHDNSSISSTYGFNFDSDVNNGVIIQHNKIIHPASYGIVIGGSAQYSNFQILSNTIEIDRNSVTGILFQGKVTNALVADNALVAVSPAPASVNAIEVRNKGNANNMFDSNRIHRGFIVNIHDKGSCMFGNVDEDGHPSASLPNTQNKMCVGVH